MSFFKARVKCFNGFPGQEEKNSGIVTYRIETRFSSEIFSMEFSIFQKYENISCNAICLNFEKAFGSIFKAGLEHMSKEIKV